MKELVALLRSKNLTISSIESLTAGLFSSTLAEVSHASAVLKGALVTYQTSCKINVLKINEELINQYGVISEECANAMVIEGMKMFQSDLVVSFTGNAGPDTMDNKPVGLVHMAINYRGTITLYHRIFYGDRNEIRKQACDYMVKKIKSIVGE